MEAKGPVLIEKAFVVEPEDGQPARIVIDLVPASEKDFAVLAQQQLPPRAPPPDPDPALALPFDAEGIPQNLPPWAAARSPKPQGRQSRPKKDKPGVPDPPVRKPKPYPVIVLDPGHGGKIPAPSAGRARQKNRSHSPLFRNCRRFSEKSARYDVVLTRSGDNFLTLKERVRIAREHQADSS